MTVIISLPTLRDNSCLGGTGEDVAAFDVSVSHIKKAILDLLKGYYVEFTDESFYPRYYKIFNADSMEDELTVERILDDFEPFTYV